MLSTEPGAKVATIGKIQPLLSRCSELTEDNDQRDWLSVHDTCFVCLLGSQQTIVLILSCSWVRPCDQVLSMECEWKRFVPLQSLLHNIFYMLLYHKSFSVCWWAVYTRDGPGSQRLQKAELLSAGSLHDSLHGANCPSSPACRLELTGMRNKFLLC